MKLCNAFKSLLWLATIPVTTIVAAKDFSGNQFTESIHAVNVQDETRAFDLSNFDKLNLGSAFVINVTQGKGYKVTATGRNEDLEDLDATVSAGELQIRYKNKNGWQRRKRVTITIMMPTVHSIHFSGATQSTITGFRSINDLMVNISGASTSTIEVESDNIVIDLSGASNVTLNGQAKQLKGNLSGATTLRAYDFKVSEAYVDASGASSARVYVTDSLHAKASGASNVTYKGTASVRSNTSGASSIRSGER